MRSLKLNKAFKDIKTYTLLLVYIAALHCSSTTAWPHPDAVDAEVDANAAPAPGIPDPATTVAPSTTTRSATPVRERFNLVEATTTLVELNDALHTIIRIYNSQKLFSVTTGKQKLVDDFLVRKYESANFANARADCIGSGGFIFAPSAFIGTITKIYEAVELEAATDFVWVDIYKDSRTSEFRFAGSDRNVPLKWKAGETATDYATLNDAECHIFKATEGLAPAARVIKKLCTETTPYICQYPIDANKRSLEQLRIDTLADLQQQKINVNTFKQFLTDLPVSPKCGETSIGGEKIEDLLQLRQPMTRLVSELETDGEAKAGKFLPLIGGFIDDLKVVRDFYRRLKRSRTTKSANGRFFCVHHDPTFDNNKSLASSILEHLKEIWKGPDPIPGWIVNITVASIAFVSMLISMLTLCCGLCINWERKSGDDQEGSKKEEHIKKTSASTLYTEVERPGFLRRMFAWCRKKPKLSEEEKLYKSIEMTSRSLRKEAKDKQQLVICTPDQTLYAPYDTGITKGMMANLSKLPSKTDVKERKPSGFTKPVTVTFAMGKLPKVHPREIEQKASESTAPSAPLLDAVDVPSTATIYTKKNRRNRMDSDESGSESEPVIAKIKHSKKDSKGKVKNSRKN